MASKILQIVGGDELILRTHLYQKIGNLNRWVCFSNDKNKIDKREEHLNSPVSIKYIKFVTKNLFTKTQQPQMVLLVNSIKYLTKNNTNITQY